MMTTIAIRYNIRDVSIWIKATFCGDCKFYILRITHQHMYTMALSPFFFYHRSLSKQSIAISLFFQSFCLFCCTENKFNCFQCSKKLHNKVKHQTNYLASTYHMTKSMFGFQFSYNHLIIDLIFPFSMKKGS